MDSPNESALKPDLVHTKKSLKEKLKYVKDNITVEPAISCYIIPGELSRLAMLNLNLEKACRVNMKFGDAVCASVIARESNQHMKEELVVQKLIASMEVWKTMLLTAVPIALILFLGAWSDRTRKRKICILLPIIGDLLMFLSNLLSVYFFYELPVQITMFLEAIFPAITGAWVIMYMGAYSYISDVSSEESRTFRIGVVNLCLTVGEPVGSALSGILLKTIGYYGVFSLAALINILNICYVLFYVHDLRAPVDGNRTKGNSSRVCGFLKSFFDIKHVKDTLSVPFKKGPNGRRIKFILILACTIFVFGPVYGEYTMRYLFTRYRFKWDALKYSFYNTFKMCVHTSGTLISVLLFCRFFKCHDSTLGLISTCSKIVGTLATSRAKTTLDMYIATVVETFNATSLIALRSLSSKLCASDELGKTLSFLNLTMVFTSFVFGPLYSWMYKVTVEMDAGTIYYVSAGITILPSIIFAWFFIKHKKGRRDCLNKYGDTNRDKHVTIEGNADGVAESGSLLMRSADGVAESGSLLMRSANMAD